MTIRRFTAFLSAQFSFDRQLAALTAIVALVVAAGIITTAQAANVGNNGPGAIVALNALGGPADYRCLDVAGNVNADGAKIQLWNCIEPAPAQQWTFVAEDNSLATGSYRIYSNKCLNVADTVAGTKTQLLTCDGSPGQRWTRLPNGSLLNPISKKCLHPTDGSSAPGTPVQVSDCSDAVAQKWYTFANTDTPVRGIAGKCLNVPGGTNANGIKLQVWSCNGHEAQEWSYIPYQNGRGGALHAKLVTSVMDGHPGLRCLDVPNTTHGTKVQLFDCNGSPFQEWQPLPNGSLLNPNSGLCLNATGNNSADGTLIEVADCNAAAGQKWNPFIQNTSINGLAGTCVDNQNFQSVNGNPIVIYQCVNNSAQRFAYVPYPGEDGGAVRWHSGSAKDSVSRCIDVPNTATGTPVQLFGCNGLPYQKWVSQPDGTLLNPNSGKCLATTGQSSTNNTRLIIDTCQNIASQKWSFAPIQ